jgi:hypothetical protein
LHDYTIDSMENIVTNINNAVMVCCEMSSSVANNKFSNINGGVFVLKYNIIGMKPMLFLQKLKKTRPYIDNCHIELVDDIMVLCVVVHFPRDISNDDENQILYVIDGGYNMKRKDELKNNFLSIVDKIEYGVTQIQRDALTSIIDVLLLGDNYEKFSFDGIFFSATNTCGGDDITFIDTRVKIHNLRFIHLDHIVALYHELNIYYQSSITIDSGFTLCVNMRFIQNRKRK